MVCAEIGVAMELIIVVVVDVVVVVDAVAAASLVSHSTRFFETHKNALKPEPLDRARWDRKNEGYFIKFEQVVPEIFEFL